MAKRANRKRGPKETINFWDGVVFKLSTKLLIGALIAVIFLTLAQCTIRKPEAPSWTTNFSVPVINRTYDMPELLDKIGQDELGIDSNNHVYFSITEDIDAQGFDPADFTAGNLSYSMTQVIGPIDINPPVLAPATVSLSAISSLASAMPGDSAIVNPISFSVFNNIPTISEFTEASIRTATMNIIVDNNLGVLIDSVEVRIYDRVYSRDVIVDTFPAAIPAGTTDTLVYNMNNVFLSNSLRTDVFAYTPGGTVQQFSTRYIGTEITFSSTFEVSSATAVVPAQPDLLVSETVSLNMNSGESISQAELTTGQLTIDAVNSTNVDANLRITAPDVTLNGIPLVINQDITAVQTTSNVYDLSGYTVNPANDSVTLDVVIGITGSNGQFVVIDETDSFSLTASIDQLSFGSVTAAFTDKEVNFTNITQNLDVPDGFDEVGLVSASLTLEVENGVDVPGNLACTLSGDNGKQLVLSGLVEARGTELRKLTSITNNDVADFMSPIPSSVTVNGAVSFGDGTARTINSNDSVYARVNIYAPLHVKVNNAFIQDLDIEREEIEQDDIDIITDHVEEARFIYTVTSHLPLGITAIISMAGDSLSLYSNPQLVIDTIFVDPAPVSPTTGITISDTVSIGEVLLDSLDIQVLRNDTLFIRPEIYLTGSDTSGVLLTGDDYLTISGRIEVQYLFDGDF